MELHIDITDDLQIDRNRLSAGLRTYFANRPDITLRLRQFQSATDAAQRVRAGP